MMKHGVRDYILKPIKRETIEQLLENLERELSETRETEEEEERCFLNQLRYLMMNAEMAEEKEWMDMESRIRRYIGNDSFRILLTSKANGERFSKCSGILLEGVEGGVLYLLPEPEAERIMKEKDEMILSRSGKRTSFCDGNSRGIPRSTAGPGNGIYTEKSCGRISEKMF